MGTTHYMSPEQTRGLEVDARTDIFSLGVVLYEMLAGRVPFDGATASDVSAAILTHQPPPVSAEVPGVPAELERIVTKALCKNRDERYQTIQDFLLDLKGLKHDWKSEAKPATVSGPATMPGRGWLTWFRTWARLTLAGAITLAVVALGAWLLWRNPPAGVQSGIRSLAILPFRSQISEAKEDYLGLGIANEIITKVSQSGALTVRPTSAIRKYTNQEIDALQAARELKVDAVLDSTFLHVGDQLRVTVNLLRVEDGASLWAEKFDERFIDIFSIQDRVSRQVAQRLQLKLSPAQQARLSKRYTSDLEAYSFYTKAMYHFYNIRPDLSTRSEADLAVDLFKKAIDLDPTYALAHCQLGDTYARIAVLLEDDPALIALAKHEIGLAERLDPQLAEVHVARAFILFSQYEGWPVEATIREVRLAQAFDPNVGHVRLADVYHHIGLEKEALEEFELGLEVDPTDEYLKEYYVLHFFHTARPDQGLEMNRRLFNRGPDWRYYLGKRMVEEAAPLVDDEIRKHPGSPLTHSNQILLLALQGKHHEAAAAIPSVMKRLRRYRGYHHGTYNVARIHALAGRSGEALKWLRVTANEGYPRYPLFARDPFLAPIRQEPDFIQFMAEMRQRWEGYQRQFGRPIISFDSGTGGLTSGMFALRHRYSVTGEPFKKRAHFPTRLSSIAPVRVAP